MGGGIKSEKSKGRIRVTYEMSIAGIQYPHTPKLTTPRAPLFERLEPRSAVTRNRKMDLMIGTESDTKRRRKAIKVKMRDSIVGA